MPRAGSGSGHPPAESAVRLDEILAAFGNRLVDIEQPEDLLQRGRTPLEHCDPAESSRNGLKSRSRYSMNATSNPALTGSTGDSGNPIFDARPAPYQSITATQMDAAPSTRAYMNES